MARRFVGSTANVFTAATAPITAVPLSMAAWVMSGNSSARGTVLGLSQGSGGGNANAFLLQLNGAAGTLSAQFTTTANGTSSSATTSSIANQSTVRWNHYGGVSSAVTSRFAYLDGVASTEQTTSRTPTGIDSTTIGGTKGTGGAFTAPVGTSVIIPSLVCEVGLWNVALTQAEFYALAHGARVSQIRPGALVGYWLPFDEVTQQGNAFNYAGPKGLELPLTGVAPNLPLITPVFRQPKSYFDFKAITTATRTTKNTRAWPLGMEIGMNWVTNTDV